MSLYRQTHIVYFIIKYVKLGTHFIDCIKKNTLDYLCSEHIV